MEAKDNNDQQARLEIGHDETSTGRSSGITRREKPRESGSTAGRQRYDLWVAGARNLMFCATRRNAVVSISHGTSRQKQQTKRWKSTENQSHQSRRTARTKNSLPDHKAKGFLAG